MAAGIIEKSAYNYMALLARLGGWFGQPTYNLIALLNKHHQTPLMIGYAAFGGYAGGSVILGHLDPAFRAHTLWGLFLMGIWLGLTLILGHENGKQPLRRWRIASVGRSRRWPHPTYDKGK